jgi:hypothetical protein
MPTPAAGADAANGADRDQETTTGAPRSTEETG